METTKLTPRERILQTAKELGILMLADFVPFSQSLNKNLKHLSLNWHIQLDLSNDGGTHGILTTDYSAGSAHCPGYKAGDKSISRHNLVQWECENGRHGHIATSGGIMPAAGNKRIEPDKADVLYSLAMDASVLDAPSFEEWASDFGYDTDSREAEKTYRACLDIALKLRNAIGEDGLARLREACQDY